MSIVNRNLVSFGFMILGILFSEFLNAEETVLGTTVICSREAYNCPTSKSVAPEIQRLRNCGEVFIVMKTCRADVHDLDRDRDGKPCEVDCGQ